MNNFLMIWPYQILIFLGIVVALFFVSLFLIFKKEKEANFLVWLLLIVLLPVIGSVAYILKYFTTKNSVA